MIVKRSLTLSNHPIFQNIINALPVLLFWTNTDHVIAGNNIAHTLAFGFNSVDHLIGKSLRYLLENGGLEEDYVDKVYVEHNEIMQTKRGQELEYTADLANKGLRTWRSFKEPLLDEQQNVIGLIGVSVDITELKEAKEKAEIASAAKSEFIANMSHDFRTPITGVVGLLNELLYSADDMKKTLCAQHPPTLKEQSNLLQELLGRTSQLGKIMSASAQELLRLCNEVLEVVRLESGRIDVTPQSFNLRDLIQQNLTLLQSVAMQRQLDVTASVDREVPANFKGIKTYLDRCLLNLLSNALKFTEKGGVKILVSLKEDVDQAKLSFSSTVFVQIRVIDTGIGIPKDKFSVIFDHFSRLTASYCGQYKGSGLGLYTVKQYVTAMGGVITVDSEVGQGSCFTITLPLEVVEQAEVDEENERGAFYDEMIKPITFEDENFDLNNSISNLSVNQNKPSIRVLVIEDNLAASMAVAGECRRLGCEVDCVDTGQAGIDRVKSYRYDLVLTDVGLPDKDGKAVTKAIRALGDHYAELPIIGLTGHAAEKEHEACLVSGMNAVLIKPAQSLVLQSALEQWVLRLGQVEEKASLPVIDWKGCLEKYQGNEAHAKEILALCYEDLTKTKAVLAAAYRDNNMRILRDELHRILGGLCYVRVPQLEQALKTMQNIAKVTHFQPAELLDAYSKAQQAIEAFCRTYEKAFATTTVKER